MASGTIILTGSNGGLSCGFVSQLLQSRYAVDYYGCYTVRTRSRASDLAKCLALAPPQHQYEVTPLDLSKLCNVRTFAKDINRRVASGEIPRIRAILLNATVWQVNGQQYSEDGYEMTFAANYLAQFLLVLLLMESMDTKHCRIVFTSSSAHDTSGRYSSSFITENRHKIVVHNDIRILAKPYPDVAGDENNAGIRRYGASKVLLLMFMYELQRRLDRDPALSNISTLSVDPGTMGGTGLVRSGSGAVRFFMGYVIPVFTMVLTFLWPNGPLRTPYKSGGDLLYAAFDTATLGDAPKAVCLDGSAPMLSSAESRDQHKQELLWKESIRLASVQQKETLLRIE